MDDRPVGRDAGAAIFGEQRECPRMSRVVIEYLDGLAPHRSLRGIDLPQVQNVTLHDSATCNSLVLDHTPIVVRLAVFLAWGLSQKHDPTNLAVGNLRLGIG